MLKKCIGNHRHERVSMQTLPRSAFKVIEAEFFLHLLMRLLADPPRFDGCRESFQRCLCRKIGEIIFAFIV